MECETCKDLGQKSKAKPPYDFKKISVYLLHCIKYSGYHKARLVSDRHLTDTPLSVTHFRVVPLKCIVLVLFLEELNGLESWRVDKGNACLETNTKKRSISELDQNLVP